MSGENYEKTQREEGNEWGINLKKKDLWLVAGGALGTLALLGLGRFGKQLRPAAVSAVREGYAFKEWLAGKAEGVKEEFEDIYAEGVAGYKSDAAASAESVRREQEILERVSGIVQDRLAQVKKGEESA